MLTLNFKYNKETFTARVPSSWEEVTVKQFIKSIDNARRKADSEILLPIMEQASGYKAKLAGSIQINTYNLAGAAIDDSDVCAEAFGDQ